MKNANDNYQHATGSEEFFKYSLGHVITEGARQMAEDNGAYWLIDIIVSYQFNNNVRSEEFQTWKLEKIKNSKFQVTATDGNDNIIAKQIIQFSDFPHDAVTLWNVNKTIMLPSEY